MSTKTLELFWQNRKKMAAWELLKRGGKSGMK
jgi:hypothetical protein